MDNSNSDPTSPRRTLKLKAGVQRSDRNYKAPSLPKPVGKSNLKPGAHWSDAYKERMQADMDLLATR
jgi:hypothetical protein